MEEMEKKPKVGGYEARLSPNAERYRDHLKRRAASARDSIAEVAPEYENVVKQVLEKLDMGVLKAVFIDEIKKSGVPQENMNVAAMEKIFPFHKTGSGATYEPLTNDIRLSTSSKGFQLAREHIRRREAIPEDLILLLQLFLVHEMCHAFSRNRINSDTGSDKEIETITSHSGFHSEEETFFKPTSLTRLEKKGESAVIFEALNEGITQRIAEEVFLEYGKRVGISDRVRMPVKLFMGESENTVPRYTMYAGVVDSMCERIGVYIGIPKEVVWNSFKRGYFENPNLFQKETHELFDETFGEPFLEEYAYLGAKTADEKLVDFSQKHQLAPAGDYPKKWMQHLGIPTDPQFKRV